MKALALAMMVTLPAGSYVPFLSGSQRQAIEVPSFKMDVSPVSRGDFLAFLKTHPEWRRSNARRIFAEKGYLENWRSDLNPGRRVSLDAPVTQVSWFAARAYCESAGKSLPTTDQWEYVADDRGQGPALAARRSLEWFGRPNDATLASGSSSETNGFGVRGLYDLVWEWTEDFSGASLSTDPAQVNARFSCGGASAEAVNPADYAAFMRYSFRNSLQATYTTANLGFRCVSGAGGVANRAEAVADLPDDSLFRLESRWKDEKGRGVALWNSGASP